MTDSSCMIRARDVEADLNISQVNLGLKGERARIQSDEQTEVRKGHTSSGEKFVPPPSPRSLAR